MGFSITVKSDINIPENLKKIDNDEFWTFAASEWHRLISPYTPKKTGNLIENVTIRPKEIEYKSPYAHYQYEGKVMGKNYHDPDSGFWSPLKKKYTGGNLKYKTDKNKDASKEWDKAAKPKQEEKLIDALQDYVDSGRLNLNG